MTREEMEMVKLVRESDVIDRTDCSELAKAFNYLFDKYVEAAVEPVGNPGKSGYWIIERDPNTGKDMSYHCSKCYDTTGHWFFISTDFSDRTATIQNMLELLSIVGIATSFLFMLPPDFG